jgi:hypothetical protein
MYSAFCYQTGNEWICTVTGHNYTNITNITHITQCNLQDGEHATDLSLEHTQNMFGNVSGAIDITLVPNFLWVMWNVKPLMNKFNVVLGESFVVLGQVLKNGEENAVVLAQVLKNGEESARDLQDVKSQLKKMLECCENNKQQPAQDDTKQDSETKKKIEPPPTSILNLLANLLALIWSHVWIVVGFVLALFVGLCHIFPPLFIAVKWVWTKFVWPGVKWVFTVVCKTTKPVEKKPVDKADTPKPVEEKPEDKPAKVLPAKKVRIRTPMKKIKEDKEPEPAFEMSEETVAWLLKQEDA